MRSYLWAGITETGALVGCGSNSSGQLGDGTGVHPSAVVTIAPPSWLQVCVGVYHLIALRADGTLWTCGFPPEAIGRGGDNLTLMQVGTDSDWAFVNAGSAVSYAIKTDGTLWGWGWSDYGTSAALTSQYQTNQATPVQIGSATDWESIQAHWHVIGKKTNGDLWGWGYNNYGPLGLGDTNLRTAPELIYSGKDVASYNVARQATTIVKTDGTLWAAGENEDNRFTAAWGSESYVLKQIGSATDWVQAVVGTNPTSGYMLALKSDGSVWACGYNYYGVLGTGDTSAKTALTATLGGHVFDQVFAGYETSYGIDSDGALWGWGDGGGTYGRTTFGSNNPGANVITTPVQIEADSYQALYLTAPVEAVIPPAPVALADLSEVNYRVTLTGAPDALADVVFAARSAVARLRSGASSYLSVVIPRTAAADQAILDRPNGEIVLEHLAGRDADQVATEIARVALSGVRSDEGARSWSITLTGYKQTTNSDAGQVEVSGLALANTTDGLRRFRSMRFPASLRAGDTAVFPDRGDESFVVGLLSLNIDAKQTTLEISELAT